MYFVLIENIVVNDSRKLAMSLVASEERFCRCKKNLSVPPSWVGSIPTRSRHSKIKAAGDYAGGRFLPIICFLECERGNPKWSGTGVSVSRIIGYHLHNWYFLGFQAERVHSGVGVESGAKDADKNSLCISVQNELSFIDKTQAVLQLIFGQHC